jgi:hypothetical protein
MTTFGLNESMMKYLVIVPVLDLNLVQDVTDCRSILCIWYWKLDFRAAQKFGFIWVHRYMTRSRTLEQCNRIFIVY